MRENLIIGGFFAVLIGAPLLFGLLLGPAINDWLGFSKGESAILAVCFVGLLLIRQKLDAAFADIDRRLAVIERRTNG